MSCDGVRQKRDPLPAARVHGLSSGQTRCPGDGGVHSQHSPAASQGCGPAGRRAQGKNPAATSAMRPAATCGLVRLWMDVKMLIRRSAVCSANP